MDRALGLVGALGVALTVAGCSAAGTAQQATVPAHWTAVGVAAAPPHRMSPVPASTPVQSHRSATSVSAPSKPPASHRSAPTPPRWASGAGAPAFPTPRNVDQHSIDAVAVTGARALASADTAVDRDDPQHTAVRAAWAGWLTPNYARQVVTAKVVGAPGIEWETWYRHRAYLAVNATPSGEDHPPDTAAVAARKVVLRERAIGRDGWQDKPTTVVVVVVLKSVNHVWRIDSDQPS